MAELGSIARWRGVAVGGQTDQIGWRGAFGPVVMVRAALSSRDDVDGSPSIPSERQTYGVLRTILWPAAAGARQFRIDLKHSGISPHPRIIVKADPILGVQADVTVVASASIDWQTLTVNLTLVVAGVLEVWREVQARRMGAYALWDNIVVS